MIMLYIFLQRIFVEVAHCHLLKVVIQFFFSRTDVKLQTDYVMKLKTCTKLENIFNSQKCCHVYKDLHHEKEKMEFILEHNLSTTKHENN